MQIANVAFFRKSWRYVHQRYFAAIPDPFGFNEPDREFYLSGSLAMRLERLAGHFLSPTRTLAQIECFLLELGNTIVSFRNNSSSSQMPDWLSRACHDIRDPEALAGGTLRFASLAARSPDHVARETKRWLNLTPTEVVNKARMEYAATRLISSDDTILDIAMQSGLSNLAHFYQLFQSRFHTTPRHYRLRERRIVS